MTIAAHESLIDAFKRAGQEQVFRHFGELDAAAQAKLMAQAEKVDLEEINALVEEHVNGEGLGGVNLEGLEPAPYISLPEHGGDAAQWREATKVGEEVIRVGRVAAFCVAGGQGTRLGHDGPKGTYPVTPVTEKSLFQVFAEKIGRSSRRYGTVIHWFILTSEINNEATVAHFEANDYFGLSKDSVHFIVQGLIAAVNFQGKILLSEKEVIARTPDGHGGSFRALVRSGAVAKMKELGVDCVSYFQVDNPLIRIVDPALIGFHLLGDSELSSKMIPKAYPLEKVGHFCSRKGRNLVIEYSDLPKDMQRQTNADGSLRYVAGSVAIHVFDRELIGRIGGDSVDVTLPFHRADKKIPSVDAAGNVITPDVPNGVKFEMFVFDALPLAKKTLIIESKREDDFSPVKNADGIDSPKTCAEDQRRMFGRWLKAVGSVIEVDETGMPKVMFEISYRFAADEADFVSQWKALETKPEICDGLIIE